MSLLRAGSERSLSFNRPTRVNGLSHLLDVCRTSQKEKGDKYRTLVARLSVAYQGCGTGRWYPVATRGYAEGSGTRRR